MTAAQLYDAAKLGRVEDAAAAYRARIDGLSPAWREAREEHTRLTADMFQRTGLRAGTYVDDETIRAAVSVAWRVTGAEADRYIGTLRVELRAIEDLARRVSSLQAEIDRERALLVPAVALAKHCRDWADRQENAARIAARATTKRPA